MDAGGAIFGGLAAGSLCGLVPSAVARSKNRAGVGNACWVVCVLAGLLGGLVFAVPVAVVCTIVIALLGAAPIAGVQ